MEEGEVWRGEGEDGRVGIPDDEIPLHISNHYQSHLSAVPWQQF